MALPRLQALCPTATTGGMISPELVEQLLHSSLPKRRGGARLPLLLLAGVVVGFALARPGVVPLPAPFGSLAPLIVVGVLVIAARLTMRRQVDLTRRWSLANESILLEKWETAATLLQGLLAKPVASFALRAQGLLGLAAVADHNHNHIASELIYEHLMGDQSAPPTQVHIAAVGLAATKLRNENLTEAVQIIDRLARQDLPLAWQAHVELVRLYREVVMGQFDDVVDSLERRQTLFRTHLSVRAGYGYGLLAFGCDQRDLPGEAAKLWSEATLLIAPEKLIDRFSLLTTMADRYDQHESPWQTP